MEQTLLVLMLVSWVGADDRNALHIRRARYFQPVWDSEGFHVGGGEFSVWRPTTMIQGYHPLGDALSDAAKKEPSDKTSLLVFDAGDGKVAAPVAIRIDSSFGNTKKARAAGFSFVELVAPSGYHCLGHVISRGHYSLRNATLHDFADYRCVRSDYVKNGDAISKQLSVVDHYDPHYTFAKTTLWKVSSSSSSSDGVQAETFIAHYLKNERSLPKNFYGLRSSMLTFANPLSNASAVLLLYETSRVHAVYHYDTVSIWNVDRCCSLGLSMTSSTEQVPMALQVALNPSAGRAREPPLVEPTGFLPVENQTHWPGLLKLVCPKGYIALGHWVQLGTLTNKKFLRCVHRRYVTHGQWTLVDRIGFWRADPVEGATAVGVSTFFVGDVSGNMAPVLRRSAVTVASGRDVVDISVAADVSAEAISQQTHQQETTKTWKGQTQSRNCDVNVTVDPSEMFVASINESLNRQVLLTVNSPVETSFAFQFPAFGIVNDTQKAGAPRTSFAVEQLTFYEQQLDVKRVVDVNRSLNYRLRAVQRSTRSNWKVDAVVSRIDGTQQSVELDGVVDLVTFVDVKAESVDVACRKVSLETDLFAEWNGDAVGSAASLSSPSSRFHVLHLTLVLVLSLAIL